MKKLERKELKCNSSSEEFIRIGYNRAIDEYEAFLPSVEELHKIIHHFDKYVGVYINYGMQLKLATAIHKRLTEGK